MTAAEARAVQAELLEIDDQMSDLAVRRRQLAMSLRRALSPPQAPQRRQGS